RLARRPPLRGRARRAVVPDDRVRGARHSGPDRARRGADATRCRRADGRARRLARSRRACGAPVAALGAGLVARADAARGRAREPLDAPGGTLCEGRNRASPLYDVRERALDRPGLGGAGARARVDRVVVGARRRRARRALAARARGRLVHALAAGGERVTTLRRYLIVAIYKGVATALAVMVT